ncbi:hypothetical protein [Allofranklinella schreckenbergeri]|uniref:hypothetical protein n=1 Tax=Allofranklinella schreckenbergeri TaxID=1076744 RepID=UPI001EEDD0E8|nr:hypothetical protein [Allofranklinella schreckenbergeri]
MRSTTTRLALACGALVLAGSATAQYGDAEYRPYVRPYSSYERHTNHLQHYSYDRNSYERFEQYRRSESERERKRRRDRNAEIAAGAAVVGGILGYALSQSQTPPPVAPSATPGYVAPPVQPVYVPPVYTPPVYTPPPVHAQQPYYQQPQYQPQYQQPYPQGYQPYQYNGRTYYRPAQ